MKVEKPTTSLVQTLKEEEDKPSTSHAMHITPQENKTVLVNVLKDQSQPDQQDGDLTPVYQLPLDQSNFIFSS